MFDILQALFWALTYILILFFTYRDTTKQLFYIPFSAILLNYAWEINAVFFSRGFLIHILWAFLDTFIFFSHVYILVKKNLYLKKRTKKREKNTEEKSKKRKLFSRFPQSFLL